MLHQINRDVIDQITQSKLETGVSNATVNRVLEVLRAILRKAEREWEWTDRAPIVRMLPEPKRRVRWLTQEEAMLLLSLLPPHLEAMVRFSLSTGLRIPGFSGHKLTFLDTWLGFMQIKRKRGAVLTFHLIRMLVA